MMARNLRGLITIDYVRHAPIFSPDEKMHVELQMQLIINESAPGDALRIRPVGWRESRVELDLTVDVLDGDSIQLYGEARLFDRSSAAEQPHVESIRLLVSPAEPLMHTIDLGDSPFLSEAGFEHADIQMEWTNTSVEGPG
jgi:hypothetical protein